jgi:outer membrane autotransporter protein
MAMGGGFKENDGGAASVTVKDYDFSTVKLRESIRFGNQGGIGIGNSFKFSPYFEFGLSQERAVTERKISGTFSNGSEFDSKLNKSERNFLNFIVGTDLKISQNVSAFINYESSSSQEENRNDVRAGMAIRF